MDNKTRRERELAMIRHWILQALFLTDPTPLPVKTLERTVHQHIKIWHADLVAEVVADQSLVLERANLVRKRQGAWALTDKGRADRREVARFIAPPDGAA